VKKLCIPAALIAALHLAIALSIYSKQYEGSWGLFLLMIPDFPVFLAAILFKDWLSYETAWMLFIVVGSIWWYGVGFFLDALLRKWKSNQ
jgi:hypothetical protein